YFYTENNKKINLVKTNEISRTISDIDYYKTDNENILGVENKIFVKFMSSKNINLYINEFELKVLKIYPNDIYLFQTKDKSLTLNIANKLYLKTDIKYAQPNFIKQIKSR
ncbi:MAG: hypothetical protein HRT40_05075, partial [Campylobacteraceae bacterium]|nr:hypothetical protein [Campylobacteraceae bacterium]